MCKFTTVKARAKINIALDVLGKREDGYHELQTIMQTLDLCDTITITKKESNEISIITNSTKIPTDNKNLAYKAAEYLKKNYSIPQGIEIKIDKNIPVAAGLAGGSADCAATLMGIRNLFKLPISNEKMNEIAVSMGADVPYCLNGGTYLAEGIGEKLTKLSPFPTMFVLLAKPNISVKTSWVYKNFDLSKVTRFPDIKKMISDISSNNIKEISDSLCNVLETVTIPEYPIINDIKKTMLEFGALGTLMSGSGPTVFGLYIYKKDCINSLKYINEKYGITESYVTSISNNY